MTAIYKRELKNYLTSLTGYLFIFFILFVTGIYFTYYQIMNAYPRMEYTLSAVTFVFLIGVPLLTMRVIAEERKQKTDQLLLTAPVPVRQIVFGKYLALITVFFIPMAIISIYPLLLRSYGDVSLESTYTAIIGFILLGCADMAVGMFISSITESQVISAVLTFVLLFAFYMMSGISGFFSQNAISTCIAFCILILAAVWILYMMIKNIWICLTAATAGILAVILLFLKNSVSFEGGIQKVLDAFNMTSYFESFVNNIMDLKEIVYFLSIIAVFLFLTEQSIQKRRWS